MTDLTDQIEGLGYSVDRSSRYHARRRGFFARAHIISMGAVLIASSSAIASIIAKFPEVAGGLAGVAALASIADLLVGFSHRARDHEVLYRRFMELAVRVVRTENPSPSDLRGWRAQRLEIETDEPQIYRALDASCHNELILAGGLDTGKMLKFSRWQRWFKNVLPYSGESFKSYEELGEEPPFATGFAAQHTGTGQEQAGQEGKEHPVNPDRTTL